MNISYRLSYLNETLAVEARWSAELAAEDALRTPKIDSLFGTGTATLRSVGALADDTPALLDRERGALMGDIDRERVALMGDLDRERAALMGDIARERVAMMGEDRPAARAHVPGPSPCSVWRSRPRLTSERTAVMQRLTEERVAAFQSADHLADRSSTVWAPCCAGSPGRSPWPPCSPSPRCSAARSFWFIAGARRQSRTRIGRAPGIR